jgi:hypothetical protein
MDPGATWRTGGYGACRCSVFSSSAIWDLTQLPDTDVHQRVTALRDGASLHA